MLLNQLSSDLDVAAPVAKSEPQVDVKPPTQIPPPVPGKRPFLTVWSGRQVFADLFVADAGTSFSARAGLEEKIDFFRNKVKGLEQQANRFREAWHVRDIELDQLETLYKKALDDAEAYETKAQQAAEQMLLAQEKAWHDHQRAIADITAQKEHELEEIRKNEHMLRAHENEILSQQIEDLQQTLFETQAARTEYDNQGKTLQGQLQEAQEQIDALHHGLGVRDEAIEALKKNVAEGQQQIQELSKRYEKQHDNTQHLLQQEQQRYRDICMRLRKTLEVAQQLLSSHK